MKHHLILDMDSAQRKPEEVTTRRDSHSSMNVWKAFMTFHLVIMILTLVAARPADKTKSTSRRKGNKNEGKKLQKLKKNILKLVKKINSFNVLSVRTTGYDGIDIPQRNRTNLIGLPVENKQPTECKEKDEAGEDLTSCPTPDRKGIFTCIDDHALCDRKYDCPNGEDEDPTMCLFHTLTKKNLRLVTNQISELTQRIRTKS